MKPNEINEKTGGERKKLVAELREELFRLRLKKASGELEKTHRLREIKRDLARSLTLDRIEALKNAKA